MAVGNGHGTAMADKINVLLRSKYTVLAIQSKEELRVERLLRRVCDATKDKATGQPFALRFWSCTQGITDADGEVVQDVREPMEALRYVQTTQERAVFVFRDVHHFLTDPVTQRALRDTARLLKATPPAVARAVVLLSPVLSLPAELEADVHIVDWPLPKREELALVLEQSINGLADELREKVKAADTEAVLSAALGLTAEEAYSAFARSLVEKKALCPALIMQEKKQIVAKSGALEWMEPLEGGLDDVGDLDEAKEWLLKRRAGFSEEARAYGLRIPKGVFLAGVPGCGKTELAKAIAKAWGLPLMRLNVGRIFGGLVGQSEGNLRRSLEVAEVVAPCVLLIDEMDKAVGGGQGGEHDGGTTSRVRGELLTWLQDRKAPVFVVATANNIEVMAEQAPELLRKGRWDELFFVDLPSYEGRRGIYAVHVRKAGIPLKGVNIDELAQHSGGFSGAEIAAVVNDSMFAAFIDGKRPVVTADILVEIKRTTPMSESSKHRIDAMRKWAKGRARLASTAQESQPGKPRQIEVA